MLSATYNPDDWIPLTTITVPKHAPSQQQVIFVNSYEEIGPLAGEWHTIDVSNLVPEEAKAIFLEGILIITHGFSTETANLQIFFRADGVTDYYIYPGQVIEASSENGQRSPMSLWIPLSKDKKFQFKWTRTNPGQWPIWSAYGINLWLNAWGK